MVRLKAVSDEAYSEKITGISIPYGAIKSVSRLFAKSLFEVFQFLMVRLKGSLPVGFSQLRLVFQFLMVRLKVSGFFRIVRKTGRFQFLMVRLKAISFYFVIKSLSISIPYGAIKRYLIL